MRKTHKRLQKRTNKPKHIPKRLKQTSKGGKRLQKRAKTVSTSGKRLLKKKENNSFKLFISNQKSRVLAFCTVFSIVVSAYVFLSLFDYSLEAGRVKVPKDTLVLTETTVEESSSEAAVLVQDSKELPIVKTINSKVEEAVQNENEEIDAIETIFVLSSLNTRVEVLEQSIEEGLNELSIQEELNEQNQVQDNSYISLNEINANSTQEEKILAEMSYLVYEKGWSVESAAGTVGNILVESGNDTTSKSPGGHYTGIAQWSRAWWTQIESWCIENGYAPYSFEGQTRAIAECPQKGSMTENLLDEFIKLNNVRQAAEFFAVNYEGCTDPNGDAVEWYGSDSYSALNHRKSEAEAALRVWYGQSYLGTK